MRKALLVLLSVSLSCAAVAAQEAAGTSTGTEVFAPFVSRIKASAGDSEVILTWRKSADVDGSFLVYRAGVEITEQTFLEATLIARLAAGVETYVDYPPYEKESYYAVLIQDSGGKLYSIFIPFRNKTTSPVTVRKPVPEEDLAAVITELKGAVKGETVVVTFTSSRTDRALMLFRSTRPIRSVDDLVLSGVPVSLEPGTTLYEDRPIPGVEYYYAAVDTRLLQTGKVAVVPGQNATRQASMVPLERAALPSPVRSRPLPRLMIPAGVEFGEELIPSPPFMLPRTREITSVTAKTVARLRSAIRPAAPRQPVPTLLEEERATQLRGEDNLLAEIIQTSFANGNYADCEDRLSRFLRIERSAKVKARANFYLAQIHFLRGEMELAFVTFLLAQDEYYRQTQAWLDACFGALGS